MGEEGRRLQRLLSRRRRTGVARQELRISTPDAERPERLARKAKPVRTEPVVNLDQTSVSGKWRRTTPFTTCSICLMKSGASSNSGVIFICISHMHHRRYNNRDTIPKPSA